ncbi:MAG: carboxypeptidase-like regulatory domain-containing protein, partial [Flavobacterium sp.]
MRYFVVFLFLTLSLPSFSQGDGESTKVSGIIINDGTLLPIANVNIINVNTVKGTVTDAMGKFSIEAKANDTLHLSSIGFQSIKVRVTNDWIKNRNITKIPLTERAYALEEIIITKYHLTGFLVIDSKLAPVNDNYRYSISGLPQGYEGGENSPSAFKKVISSVFNPADALHKLFGKKPTEMRRLREMKKDDTVRNALASKFDRETLGA